MPRKCYYKPNRKTPRTFGAKDVGRVACAAVANGSSPEDIRKEVEKCIPLESKECEEAKDSVTRFAAAAGAAVAIILALIPAVQGVKRFLRVMRLVFPTQVRRIEDMIDKTILESEKTKRILDDIIERARELERVTP